MILGQRATNRKVSANTAGFPVWEQPHVAPVAVQPGVGGARLSACPVCEPDEFDGDVDVTPAAVPCLAHVNHAVMRFFPYPYEIPVSNPTVSPTPAARRSPATPGSSLIHQRKFTPVRQGITCASSKSITRNPSSRCS